MFSRFAHRLLLAGVLVCAGSPALPYGASDAAAQAPQAGGTVRFVDDDAQGAATGLSWHDAFPDLQLALAVASPGDEVWIAEGVYYPTDGADREATFWLPNGVALYGGFAGTETERDERDWTVYASVLSGDLGVPGEDDDNSYRIVSAPDTDSTTVLDGLTIRDARNSGSAGGGLWVPRSSLHVRNGYFAFNSAEYGGGIFATEGRLRVEDTVFEENRGGGGGMYALGGAPHLSRVVFRSNSGGGAGMTFAGGSAGVIEDGLFEGSRFQGALRIEEGSRPRIERTVFRDNQPGSLASGGAVFVRASDPLFRDCLFEYNSVHNNSGGAVYVEAGATPLFERCTFLGNDANGGGAVYASRSYPVFLACRFERNANLAILSNTSAPVVLSSVFAGNFSNSSTGAIAYIRNGPPPYPPGGLVASTLFVGNRAQLGGAVVVRDGADVTFVNVTFAANEARDSGGALWGSFGGGLANTRLHNTILWHNSAPDGSIGGEGTPEVLHSLVEGGYAGTAVLDADPLFVRPPAPGPDGTWGTADDDYGDLRLRPGSPALDHGLVNLLPPDTWDLDGDGDTAEPLPFDLNGDPRVAGASVDAGAYEGAVEVSVEPGVPEPEAAGLRLYPNPAGAHVTVETAARTVVIYDVLGRAARRVAVRSGRVAVETAGLAAGVYLVRASDGSAARLTIRR